MVTSRSLFDSAGNPLPKFVPQTGGLANAVYTDTGTGTILKGYSNENYYRAELMAAASGFPSMPTHLESGEYQRGWYVLMENVGEPVEFLTVDDIPPLVSTLAELHTSGAHPKARVDLTRFDWLREQRTTLLEMTGRDISHELDVLARDTEGVTACLVHGDLDITNVRRTPSGFVFIDFDEAGYSLPYLDIGKLYWSGGVPMQEYLLKALIEEYVRKTQYSLSMESVHRWILIAGADFWLWRHLYAPTARAEDALEALRTYAHRNQ